MAQAIRGVNKFFLKFSISNYSLTIQIIIINFLTALIGLVFLFLVNYFLVSNSENLVKQTANIKNDLNKIVNYLSTNAVIRVPEFNEKNCGIDFNDNSEECGEIILSKPQLDPTSTQKYLMENYANKSNSIRVFDASWIKFGDTEDIYSPIDVVEVDLEFSDNKTNIYNQYKDKYFEYFKNIKKYFNKSNIESLIANYKSDIFFVKETIKSKDYLSLIYLDDSENIVFTNSNPILKNDKTYGVVIVSGILNKDDNEAALISFNLINLFIIIILTMFVLSIMFSQSIVLPIKILSNIVRQERDKSNKNKIKFLYPNRKDEIGILSNEIREMSKDLKERINDIENFASDVSHELKNPITSLKSSNELLIQNKINQDQKNLLLKNMQKDIVRMNSLVTDISSYTLTQVEITDELFYEFDLVAFLKEFLQSYNDNKKSIKINFKHNQTISKIYANKDKLAQVFINLIDNSMSHSPNNSEILIDIKNTNESAIIYIADQGEGIPMNLKDKIFERFYTDRSSNQTKHTGLGLSISKKIVENFSGSIKLSNVKFKQYFGACFEINLPLKD